MKIHLAKPILRHVNFFRQSFLFLQLPFLPLAGGTDSWKLARKTRPSHLPLHCHYPADPFNEKPIT